MIGIDYRPKTLNEIIGHDKVRQEIINRFENNTLPQVMYFTGISGGGKTTFAMNIAKVIQCENKIDKYTPCNVCEHCMDINKESFIRGTFLFNGSNLDIESMRQIDELSTTSNWVSNKTVIILDELQELSSNKKAQKNLLKALEKKNEEVYFILLSMDDSKVDKAIKNRTVTYKLYPIDTMLIGEHLYNICSKMNLDIDEQKSNILISIAENSFGSVRQACSYLERVISGNIWTDLELKQVLHFTNFSDINDICIKLIDRDPELFSLPIEAEILDRVKTNLVRLAKNLSGAKLSPYEKSSLEGLIGYKNADLRKVFSIISILNNMFKFPYLNREILESILLELFLDKEVQTVSEESQPKRRRVPQ